VQVPLKLTRLERLTFRLFVAWLPAGPRLFAERGIREARAALKRAMPFMLCGDCLAPWLRDGDVLCVTTEIEPQPGDLVLTTMAYRRPHMIGEGSIRYERAVKQLAERDGALWLACADGAVPAEGHEIEGTVVCAWTRGRLFPRLWRMAFAACSRHSVAGADAHRA